MKPQNDCGKYENKNRLNWKTRWRIYHTKPYVQNFSKSSYIVCIYIPECRLSSYNNFQSRSKTFWTSFSLMILIKLQKPICKRVPNMNQRLHSFVSQNDLQWIWLDSQNIWIVHKLRGIDQQYINLRSNLRKFQKFFKVFSRILFELSSYCRVTFS